MTDPDYVLVRRDALEALIEDVRAIASCTGPDGSMVYCRLMKKIHAVEVTDGPEDEQTILDRLGWNAKARQAGLDAIRRES